VAAHTDSIAKGDKVYVGAAIQAPRFAHPALAAAANRRDADERQDDADDSDDDRPGVQQQHSFRDGPNRGVDF
jgi:hypothetical protein